MKRHSRENQWAWVALFIAPSLLGLLVFTVYPILASFWVAFHDWNLLSPPEFVGFANFVELWGDADFWNALQHTLVFIGLYVPTVFLLGLALALFLNQKLRGMLLIRTA